MFVRRHLSSATVAQPLCASASASSSWRTSRCLSSRMRTSNHEELRVVRVRLLDHYLLNPHLLGMELCLEVGSKVSGGGANSTGETVIGTVSRAKRGATPTLGVGMRGMHCTHTLCRGHWQWGRLKARSCALPRSYPLSWGRGAGGREKASPSKKAGGGRARDLLLPALPGTSAERQSTGRDLEDALRGEPTEKPSTGEVTACPARATGARLLPRRGGGGR